MHSLASDLRYAARRLFRAPLFTTSAVLVLAFGIGLNAIVFNLVDTALFRPLPFDDADRIVRVYQHSDSGAPSSTSFPAYRDMAEMTDVFAGVGATSGDSATWERAEGPREASVEYATSSYLPVLGLDPYLGSWFTDEHDRVGGPMAAVVSYAAWRTRLGGDPSVIGRTVRLNNRAVTIIGVGPEAFNGEANALVRDFWLSISSTPIGGPYRVSNLERRGDHWYQVTARLAPGVTIAQARAALQGLAARLAEAYPDINEGRGISVFANDDVRFHPFVDRMVLGSGVALIVVAASILLLACSNLANLLLTRGISRSAELALRAALGADRLRVARLLLFEALLLSALGAAAGLALAAWCTSLLSGFSLPSTIGSPGGSVSLGFDHRVATFGVLTALTTGLLFGLLPALRTARTDVAATLRDVGRTQSPGRGVSLLRKGLVVAQVSISVVLVIGAALLARSLANAERVDPGVDAARIAVIGTNLSQGGVTEAQAPAVTAELLGRIEAIPGVERAALTTRLPLQGGGTTSRVVEGYTPPAGTSAVELPFAFVSPGYFETMGIPLLAGRAFSTADRADTRPVVVVNEAAAHAYWGGDAVGGRLRQQSADSDWLDVVGVVADTKVAELTEAPTPMLYASAEQFGAGVFSIVARTSGDPAALTFSMRRALQDYRASLPVTRLLPLEAHFGDAMQIPRAATLLMGGFSMLALLIATFGIHAIVAFAVERRTHELGIRAALGATGSRIVRMVLWESLATVSLGLAAGLVLAALLARGLESVLFGVPPVDLISFAGASVLLLGAACLAALLPARRAAGANPVDVLRSQ